ncbi:MAG: triose-phosphate isomerase [Patescibacteria group bacterium]
MKKRYLIANWKMNLDHKASCALSRTYAQKVEQTKTLLTILCPSYSSLRDVAGVVSKHRHIYVGAQNCFWQDSGSYTGEESPTFLHALGVRYVLIGHSERRMHLRETDTTIGCKMNMIIEYSKLIPILCVGENSAERKSGKTVKVLERQLATALNGIITPKPFLIAYEPVWAIGTGNPITVQDCKKVSGWIRTYIQRRFGAFAAQQMSIVYGGSVDSTNAYSIMTEGGVEGLLVGSASLNAKTLVQLHTILRAIP